MHHVVLEQWSRGDGPIHRRDARAKVIVALVFLVTVATTPGWNAPLAGGYAVLLLIALLASRVPARGLLLRSLVVLPFTGVFALISALAGDPRRAVDLLCKSYLSAVVVLLLVATTPMPRLFDAVDRLGAPRMVVLVVQFLYRYLFVISEQGQHMRNASQCRGGFGGSRRSGFRAAAGALAVLFARSYQRAEAIHRAMLARGFQGRFHPVTPARAGLADLLFLLVCAGAPIAVRLASGGIHPWLH